MGPPPPPAAGPRPGPAAGPPRPPGAPPRQPAPKGGDQAEAGPSLAREWRPAPTSAPCPALRPDLPQRPVFILGQLPSRGSNLQQHPHPLGPQDTPWLVHRIPASIPGWHPTARFTVKCHQNEYVCQDSHDSFEKEDGVASHFVIFIVSMCVKATGMKPGWLGRKQTNRSAGQSRVWGMTREYMTVRCDKRRIPIRME